MMRAWPHKFWTMWGPGWNIRERVAHTPGCWAERGGASFFSESFAGKNCNINWLSGGTNGPGFTDASLKSDGAPAVFGTDVAVLELCLTKLGRWRKVYHASDGEIASACLAASYNVMRLPRRQWTICTNYEFIACAARGLLPGQGNKGVVFTAPPGSLFTRDLHANKLDGFTMEDVFYLELCVLSELCSNGADLFSREANEPFLCETSESRFTALGETLMGMDVYGG